MTRWVLRLLLLPPFLIREIWRRLRAGPREGRVIRKAPYRNGAVAVLALYQDGRPRADILSLCLALRRSGTYVVAVNTGRLDDAGARLPVDAYIERGNYGRDFASYQAGLRLAQEIAPEAERWLLFNDSVFYVSHGLEPFLERLLRCHADICSATESVEVLPHQTSFCLSFSRACVQHPRFQKFWRRYVGMDLRPWTVFLGEIALSRVLLGTGLTRETLGGMEAVKRAFSQGVADPVGRAEGQGVGQSAPWQGEGNMTHRAPDLMLDLGLPMVKLDLPHRGGKTDSELQGLLTRLEPVESQSLDELWRLQAEKHQRSSRLDRLGARCGLA